MLSYMLPVEEKPPPGPAAAAATSSSTPKTHQQLQLTLGGGGGGCGGGVGFANGRTSAPISKETSVSSFASDLTTCTASHSSMTPTSTSDKANKPKLMINGGKHQTLKRVSFGSSKGSMVETLIFESPLTEEPEPSPIPEDGLPFPADHDQTESEREKVRVTFFQQSKPLEVDLPDEPAFTETDFMMASPVTLNETNHVAYNRTESVESGWDNPFRPGGDLSREADEIVELIKGGKPITPTPGQQAPSPPHLDNHRPHPPEASPPPPATDVAQKRTAVTQLRAAPAAQNSNGTTTTTTTSGGGKGGPLDVQRSTVRPEGEAPQIERVTIKKKPKCKCCVIQ